MPFIYIWIGILIGFMIGVLWNNPMRWKMQVWELEKQRGELLEVIAELRGKNEKT